jgi:hypothetical protein
MMLPTIHLNGTSREQLFEGYMDALAAIEYALEAVKYAAPNGRDYYPQGPDAMAQAGDEHILRMKALDKIAAELRTIAEHCDG